MLFLIRDYEDAERVKKVTVIMAEPDKVKAYKALSNTIHRQNLQQENLEPGLFSAKGRLSRNEVNI